MQVKLDVYLTLIASRIIDDWGLASPQDVKLRIEIFDKVCVAVETSPCEQDFDMAKKSEEYVWTHLIRKTVDSSTLEVLLSKFKTTHTSPEISETRKRLQRKFSTRGFSLKRCLNKSNATTWLENELDHTKTCFPLAEGYLRSDTDVEEMMSRTPNWMAEAGSELLSKLPDYLFCKDQPPSIKKASAKAFLEVTERRAQQREADKNFNSNESTMMQCPEPERLFHLIENRFTRKNKRLTRDAVKDLSRVKTFVASNTNFSELQKSLLDWLLNGETLQSASDKLKLSIQQSRSELKAIGYSLIHDSGVDPVSDRRFITSTDASEKDDDSTYELEVTDAEDADTGGRHLIWSVLALMALAEFGHKLALLLISYLDASRSKCDEIFGEKTGYTARQLCETGFKKRFAGKLQRFEECDPINSDKLTISEGRPLRDAGLLLCMESTTGEAHNCKLSKLLILRNWLNDALIPIGDFADRLTRSDDLLNLIKASEVPSRGQIVLAQGEALKAFTALFGKFIAASQIDSADGDFNDKLRFYIEYVNHNAATAFDLPMDLARERTSSPGLN